MTNQRLVLTTIDQSEHSIVITLTGLKEMKEGCEKREGGAGEEILSMEIHWRSLRMVRSSLQ